MGPETTSIGPVLSSRHFPRFDFGHAAASGRKQGCMPSEEPFVGEGLIIMAGSVEHHFDNAFDVAVGGLEGSDVHTEPPCD